MVVLHALGQALIRTAVGTITPRAHNGFSIAMYLIAERGRRIPRESLLSLFWPGGGCRSAAAHALSVALHKLRCRGFPVATDNAQFVWLPREAAILDVDMLAVDPVHILLERDLSVLPGYSATGSPAFLDWVDEWRRAMETRVIAQIIEAMNRAETSGEWRAALGLAGFVLRANPDHREALRVTARAADHLHRERTGGRAQLPGATRSDKPPPARTAAVSEAPAADVWTLPIARYAPSRDTRLVGRDREIGVLCNALDETARARGSSVFVSGAAGMGKTRLIREAMTESRIRGMSVAFTSCQEYDRHRPLSAFVDLVPDLRGLPGAAGADPSMQVDLDRLTRSDPSPSQPRHGTPDPDYAFGRLRRALFDLTDAISHEQSLLLVVDNVQWLDAASWSLLREMMTWSETRPIVIALTSREPWNVDTQNLPPTSLRLMPLAPLNVRATADLARNYATMIGHQPPAELLEWCTAASEGNPYMLEELLNHWVATGEQFRTPPSLMLLLDTRLERLTPSTLHVLQACAILGKNSTAHRIEHVLQQSSCTLFAALEELGRAGMLRAAPDHTASGNRPILCRHDALAQAATRRLSEPGRELLHRRAGEALERELDSVASASLLWDCAGHWFDAGNSRRAVDLGLTCVAHLLEVGLPRAAADACEKTLRYCVLPIDRDAVLRAHLRALYLNRQWAAVFATIAELRSLQPETPVYPHDDLELIALDATWSSKQDLIALLEATARCATCTDADPSHRVQAATLALKVATNLGDTAAMVRIFAAVQDCLDSVAPVARATIEMIFHAICGDVQVAAGCARYLLLDPDADILPELARLTRAINCGVALCRAGAMKDGYAEFTRVFERGIELQAFGVAGEACVRAFTGYLDSGEMELASAWVHKFMRLPLGVVELRQERRLRLALSRIQLWRGDHDAADHLLVDDEHPLYEDPVPSLRAAALSVKVRIAIARDRRDAIIDAVTQLRETGVHLRTMGLQDYEVFSAYLGLRHLGQDVEALDLLTNYLAHERRDLLPVTSEIADEEARLKART